MSIFTNRKFLYFVLKFLFIFAVLYFGTLAVIGLASPDGYYSPFLAKYLDYVSWLKYALISTAKFFLSLFNIDTVILPGFVIKYLNGQGIFIAMNCVGYGVYSFWIAYVLANSISIAKKTIWVLGGVLLLFTINAIRITLFLTAINKHWPMPLNIDHHTWFNIAAYLAIFAMMWKFERNIKDSAQKKAVSNESELSTIIPGTKHQTNT